MKRQPRWAAPVTLLLCAAAIVPASVADAAPELTPDQAQDAMVDLGVLWERATHNEALSEQSAQLLGKYLTTRSSPKVVPAAAAFESDWGLDLTVQPPPRSDFRSALRLPITLVTADDAGVIHRRRALLALYLRKHDAVVAVWRSGKVPRDVRMPAEEIRQHGQRAAAARVELFLLERIALGEGETQEQKCAAYLRATAHARALGLESPGTPPAAPLADTDLPAAWRELLGAARAHHATEHAPSSQALTRLCTQGEPASPSKTREQLEGMLTTRLTQNVDGFFGDRRVDLETVQASFTEMVSRADIAVPREAIADLYKQVADAQATYDLVYGDAFGLTTRVDKLQAATARMLQRLSADPSSSSAFASEARELMGLRGELARFVALARSLASLPIASRRDRQALAPCEALPEGIEAAPVADLAARVEACLSAATALRDRLFLTPDVPPEREALLHHLQSLSHAFLTSNPW